MGCHADDPYYWLANFQSLFDSCLSNSARTRTSVCKPRYSSRGFAKETLSGRPFQRPSVLSARQRRAQSTGRRVPMSHMHSVITSPFICAGRAGCVGIRLLDPSLLAKRTKKRLLLLVRENALG